MEGKFVACGLLLTPISNAVEESWDKTLQILVCFLLFLLEFAYNFGSAYFVISAKSTVGSILPLAEPSWLNW